MIRDSARSVVIAGAGDVGLRLARLRADLGDDAIALRRSLVPEVAGIRHMRADLASGAGLSQLPRRPEALVFCAAPDAREPGAYRRLFLDGLRRLLDAVDPARVVFVSSTAVYAEDAGEWLDEGTLPRPPAFNGEILLEAEATVAAHARGIVLRLSGIYGPDREWMLRRARGDGMLRRHWGNRIHVQDAAAALSHLMDLEDAAPLYLGNDDLPALECDVVAWVREREGLPALAVAAGPETGRRISNARLRASGWMPAFPDYRAGYAPLLAKPGV
jgi:nucleoside-diphosphate-sugar epimerase